MYLESMVIDDVEVTPSSAYTFTTTGEHSVVLKFRGKVNNINYMFSGTSYTTIDFEDFDMSAINNINYLCASNKSLKQVKINPKFNNMSSVSYAFSLCEGLEYADISNWDFNLISTNSGVTASIFSGCTKLSEVKAYGIKLPINGGLKIYDIFKNSKVTSLNVGSWDISNVKKLNSLFYNCTGLTSLDSVKDWDTSNVTDMSSMFGYCYGLTSLDSIKDWDVSKVINMYYMFEYCLGLTSLDLTNWDTSNVTNMSSMFSGCRSLTSLDLSNWDLSNVTSMSGMFSGCTNLSEIKMSGDVSNVTYLGNMFTGAASTGTFYYNPIYDYSKIIAQLPSTWTAVPTVTNISATELNINAEDVNGRKTRTKITYTATLTGNSIYDNSVVTWTYTGNSIYDNSVVTWTETGTSISSDFGQNTSETEERQIEITFEYEGLTATTTIMQGVWTDKYYEVNLNSQWRLSTSIANPDSSLYEGVYESFSNKGVHYSAALMYIDIVGYTNFKFYVRSYAESSYDYVVVSNLDCTLNSGTTSGTNVKMTTTSRQNSGTAIGSYTLVEFTGIDGNAHRITVMYRKDGSGDNGTDQGYVLIPKNQ